MKGSRKRTSFQDLRATSGKFLKKIQSWEAIVIIFTVLPIASQFPKSMLFLGTIDRKIPNNTLIFRRTIKNSKKQLRYN